jgi:hypothetical protein
MIDPQRVGDAGVMYGNRWLRDRTNCFSSVKNGVAIYGTSMICTEPMCMGMRVVSA